MQKTCRKKNFGNFQIRNKPIDIKKPIGSAGSFTHWQNRFTQGQKRLSIISKNAG